MAGFLRKLFLYQKYRKKIKKKRTVNFKISDPAEFLARLERHGIDYVVLRWPQEAQDILSGKRFPGADIDILVKTKSWKEIFNLCYDLISTKNAVKIDIYSHQVTKGFQYHGFPYYPFHLANEIFENATKEKYPFYYLEGLVYIKSLAYHLVYHKGEASGIPLDDQGEWATTPKKNYGMLLQQEADSNGVSLPSPLTILRLAQWLKDNQFEMPYDLLMRYPQNACLSAIKKSQESSFVPLSKEQYLFIYMLRSSLENTAYEAQVIELLKKHFVIDREIRVDTETRMKLKRDIRGGNWHDKHQRGETLPYLFLLAHDTNPEALTEPDPAYPLIDNKNFYKKLIIREEIQELLGTKSNCIHGTDNLLEAAYVLSVLRANGLYE